MYDNKPLKTSNSTNTRVIQIDRDYEAMSDGKHTVACKIRVISVDDAISYTAISYMWGDHNCEREILLDGRPFYVRSNLFDLLETISEEGSNEVYWIDALCINQVDTIERNHQVGLMGQIYSSAENVLVWPGNGVWLEKGDNGLWQAIEELKEKRLSLHEHFDGFERHAEVLKLISQHPYWQRAWIMQEVILAKEIYIHCGTHIFSGSILSGYLLSMAAQTSRLGSVEYQGRQRIVNRSIAVRILRKWVLWHTDRRPYIYSWENFEFKAKCSDVRDRIYSMIAFTSPAKRILPDYDKTSSDLFDDLVSQLQYGHSRAYFVSLVWNLL